MDNLLAFLLNLVKQRWSGKIILHFHQGTIKKKTKSNTVMVIDVEEEQELKI